MKKKQILLLALLCAFAQGAWAQANWDAVYAMTQTTSANWTALTEGSTTGQTLGSAGNTTYYYANSNLSFTNSNAGGSALTIQGTVYLYVPEGVTITCTGANADGATGAGAGIELASGNTLYLLGSGTVNATGGNAANGGDGGNGDHSYFVYNSYCQPGNGGNGGNGGGGAGAGIGTRGGNGGNGGSGATAKRDESEGTNIGVAGSAGNAGTTAGAMGNLYVVTSFVNLNASGGSAGSGGSGGARGNNAAEDPYNQYNASGGGGGGAGGFGGAASNIGTGGPGGGGGGGGAAGNSAWRANSTNGFYRVGAGGGSGGYNCDGSQAANGTSSELTNPYNAEYNQGLSGNYDDDGWEEGNGMYSGGSGGACGSASTSGSAINLAIWPTSGTGTEESPYLINNVYEWNTFAVNVSSGNSYSGQYVQLAADISVTTMAGNSFSGTFDGGDHTITANISGTGSKALFNRLDGGTIQNLKLAGSVSGGIHTAALLVSLGNSGANLIQNCVVSANVTCSGSHMGGFLAHGNTSNITINCCVFSGKMTGGSSAKGVFYGWGDASGTSRVTNCLYLMADGQDLTGLDLVHLNGATTLVDRCYKNTATGSYGTQATVSTEAPGCSGNLMYDCSIVKAYQGAILYGGNYYYDNHALYNHSGYDPYNLFYNFVTGNPYTRTVFTVYSDITWSNRMIIENDVVIYLAEGATLHAQKGIQVSTLYQGYPMNSNLTIDGPGTLIIDGCDAGKSGIGAQSLGSITINGGTINVKGGGGGAGIGRDAEPVSGGTITINGGIINATGGTYDYTPNGVHFYRGGAGIGDGAFSTQEGINVTINGGVVNARGGFYASGIGGGAGNDGTDQGKCGTITINGGQVTAIGGEDAPGIGPGYVYGNGHQASGTLTLSWTNQYEDFVSSSQFRDLQSISFATGKQFLIDGTSTIATSDNIGGQGIRLVPYVTEPVTLTGAGTAENPWRITCTEDWNKLVYNVNAGNSYSGQYVQLDVDIDITRGMGVYNENPDSAHPFSGTFLGNNKTITSAITDFIQGVAPFRYIDGATIKDLKVAGAIASSNRHAAALVGFLKGTGNSIENCVVTADVSGNEYVGGIVGHALNGSISLSGCAFSGLMTGGSNYMGAFIGWDDGGTKTATDCLYLIPVGQSTTNLDLVKEGGTLTVTNCYKTTEAGTYGTLAFAYATATSNLGDLTHDYGMLKAYAGGILFDGTYYIDHGSGTEDDPYIISNEYDWNTFAYDVNNGKNYSDKFVRLDVDIDISQTVGLRDDRPFSGTFLGNDHTITASIISTTTGEGANEQGVAPFHYINNATIKDLTVAGSIASASYHTSGIVGFANGTNLIENCAVTATLNVSSNYAGGFIGHGLSSNTTIRGCVFAGTINGVDGNRENIGGIWGWSNSGTPTLENCLEAGTYTNIASMHPMGLQGGSGTITNCFYVNPQVGSPQNACTVSGAVQAVTHAGMQPEGEPTAIYNTSDINVYVNGISYGGTFYYALTRTIEGYEDGNDHWAFIASPVEGSIAPTAVGNLVAETASEYDLYQLNPSTVVWQNYKEHEGNTAPGFNLVNGQGYLYATKETKNLVFSGTFNTGSSMTIEDLPAGFNLVGNPFIVDAYVNKPYYTLNSDGSAILTTTSTAAIAPCHGVIVEVTGNENVIFNTSGEFSAAPNNGGLQIALSQANTRSNALLDNAIVSFNEGTELGKFYFGEQVANIYIPQGGKEYAIAVVGRDGVHTVSTNEIPVNFKAKENGTYTISVNPEGVEMAYLHLIDNLTGADVDLLSPVGSPFAKGAGGFNEPATYTFTAKTTTTLRDSAWCFPFAGTQMATMMATTHRLRSSTMATSSSRRTPKTPRCKSWMRWGAWSFVQTVCTPSLPTG